MLQLTLARDHLLCGYGTQMDPSRDINLSGQAGDGCRPHLFFGPSRDALNLITQKLHAAFIVRPKVLRDLDIRVCVLALPAGDLDTAALWREQTLSLGQQLRPLVHFAQLKQTESRLESQADVYHQTLTLDGTSELPAELRAFTVQISAGIESDALREQWKLTGLPSDWTAQLAYWFQPEIAASSLMQSSLFYETARALVAYRGATFFGLQAFSGAKSLAVAFADTGSSQHNLAKNRWADIVRASWSEDEVLGLSAERLASSPWLPLEPRGLLSLGAVDGLIVWSLPAHGTFDLQFRLGSSLESFHEALPPLDFDRLRKSDGAWLAQQKPLPPKRSARLRDLYARTLLTLRQMQDPEGGIIAAPEFHYALTHCGGYGYCWGRDAGFISFAMDVCGMHAESAHFYRYMQRCQSQDGSFLHRHDMKGNLGASWGLLQPDETGSVLFGLWQHFALSHNEALIRELEPMISKAADWLAKAKHSTDPELPIEGFDLWEEREGVHLYTVAAMAAGLDAAIALYQALGKQPAELWQTRAQQLKTLCHSPRFREQKNGSWSWARTLRRRLPSALASRLQQMGASVQTQTSETGRTLYELDRDHVADISQLAVFYPYASVLDKKTERASLESLVSHLHARLWRAGQGGTGRYEADYYRDGNPWILSTLWLSLAAAELGQLDIARQTWDWVLQHTPSEGMLPEQIDPKTGRAAWVLPLTWSHAMFALALHHLPDEVFS